MGAGINRINKYTVRKATQAMANIIKKEKLPLKVCVSYDSRHNSDFFAKEVCGVLAANGIQAFIYPQLTPVPLLSFAIRFTKASAGIMITASHNPIEYNGFKAYWSDGAQITPPIDKNIIDEYKEMTDWNKIFHTNFKQGQKNKLIHFLSSDVTQAYYESVKKIILNKKLIADKGDKLKVIYTPIHGTGLKPCQDLAQSLGFRNFLIVEEQAEPNGNFPTVKSPNPEYPEALTLAVELMKKNNADIALGTDPDADRLGVVVNHKGKIHFLNGNQIATLFVYYILSQKEKLGKLTPNSLLMKSIVTSDIQQVMADKYNVHLINTLTGFKWMAKVLNEKEKNEEKFDFLFANEESFGFMGHSDVRDKDGVCAVIQMCEIALFYKEQNKTLIDVLDDIYRKFGLFYDTVLSLDYHGIEGLEKISSIMNKLRQKELTNGNGESLIQVKDYQNNICYDVVNKNESKFSFEKSNLLEFTYSNGVKFLVRPSGTEPKIKFYFMLQFKGENLDELKILAKEKTEQWQNLIKEFCDKAQ
mgnify:FL=1